MLTVVLSLETSSLDQKDIVVFRRPLDIKSRFLPHLINYYCLCSVPLSFTKI